ncbi:ABC transporter permease [Desulfobacter postgatei]|uniref:ABC transporter permease n=1 Tax=Desulfobacter postgatei TaxID=2293 RepID=UPI00259BE08E|nr:ABC transporter permease [uncultured Desulfobacter sp.]
MYPMKLLQTIRIAFKALRRNPMRAMLTTLGIVIGVSAVISMMEISAGSSTSIKKKISSMGANVLIIIPKTAETTGVTAGAGSAMTLTPEDSEAVAKHCPSIRSAAPIVRARAQAVYGNKNWVPDSIEGTTPDYLDVREWSLDEGVPFTHIDVSQSDKVCLIGKTVASELFGQASPLGKNIRLRNVSLRVIGVLSKKGANLMGQDQDDTILAPWTTIKYRIAGSRLIGENQSVGIDDSGYYPSRLHKIYPERSSVQLRNNKMLYRFANVDAIMAFVRSADLIDLANQEITDILRSRHNIGKTLDNDFEIINLTEITQTLTATTSLMTNLLLCIATVSLVVGGVGIMNIMLVSVTERTSEIGLRMAVGAKPRDILQQFLIEAIVLCLAGGTIGIIWGNAVSFLVWLLLQWPVEASPMATVVSVIVSMSVGVLFGFYPAWKASNLDPIVALRHE